MVVLYGYTEKPITTIFVIMLASIVTNIEGNPISSNAQHQKYWWHEPCTQQRTKQAKWHEPCAGRTKTPGRQTRDIPRTVRTQINVTYQIMKDIYNEHKPMLNMSGTSLPHLVHKSKLKLSVMHYNLQYYAATIHNIMKIGVSSDINSCDRELYFAPLCKMKGTLKTLLCEIVTEMKNEKKRVKKYVLPSEVTTLGPKLDCTKAIMYRSVLIARFKRLLENMNKQYNRKMRRNKSSNRSVSNSSSKSSQQI